MLTFSFYNMAAVLTTTMTLRIILSVRGSLAQGGSYAGSSVSSSNCANTTHLLSAGRPNPAHRTQPPLAPPRRALVSSPLDVTFSTRMVVPNVKDP